MISKEEIIKKIGSLLEDLTVKFDRVSNPDNDVHPLEFQLFEVEASYFAEHTNILRKLEEETVKHDKEVIEPAAVDDTEEPVFFTPPINKEIAKEEKLDSQETQEEIPGQEESPAPAPEPRDEKTKDEKSNDDQETKDDEKTSDDNSPLDEVNPPEVEADAKEAKQTDVKEEQDIKEETDEKEEDVNAKSSAEEVVNKIVIEEKQVSVVSDKPMSLNDRLSESRKSMATGSSPSHGEAPPRIRDIKSVISLNDKLMFIKDLFNGYSLAYSEAIELLNRFESFEDAQRFLQTNYAEKNSWETKQASVDKLNAILRKRYNS